MRTVRSGFTMMEMLVVITIIGVLLAFMGPGILKYLKKGTETEVDLKFNNIKSAMLTYKMEFGHFPTKEEGGLEALVKNPHPNDAKFKQKDAAGLWPMVKDEGTISQGGLPFIYNMPPQRFKDKYKYYEVIWLGETNAEDAPDLRSSGE